MHGKELCRYVVDHIDKLGADYVEVRFVDSRDENYIARNGSFLGVQNTPGQGIGIRVLIDGSIAFGSLDTLDKKKVETLARSLVKMAKLSDRKEPVELSDEAVVKTSWSVPVKIPFADISREEKQKFISELDKDIKKSNGRIIKNRMILMNLHTSNNYIVTSHGSSVESDKSLLSLYNIMNADFKGANEQRMFGLGSSSGWEWLDKHGVASEICKEANSLAKTVRNAEKVKFKNPVDVVVSGEVSGIMAHENVGHPSEADRIIGREGAQAGESFYKDLLDGNTISDVKLGTDVVTVVDDPTLKGSPGFYLYDDECVTARPRYLIKDGRLNELLLNREFAHLFGMKSNASARTNSYSREPIPRMSNTFFKPGRHSVDGLVDDVKNGMLMKSFTEWNIDDRRFHSKYVGLEAYVIKNGEVTDTMVKRPVLELTTRGILGSIDAVSKGYVSRMAFCGKSDPMQPVPVSVGGPHVRMRNIQVG